MANQQPSNSYVGPSPAIPGKPNVQELPTPNLDDRIVVIRKDTRAAGYKQPEKGDTYTGLEPEKMEGFLFATSKSLDQIGWVNEYWLNERQNQNDYNFEISYPFADPNYPTITRTYVVLRGDQREDEPAADSKDPVYPDLFLTDHKIGRLQNPEIDALFVSVIRTYERLPGPVITSYQENQVQQLVTVQTQTVKTDAVPPLPLSALTEIAKEDRKTTAKAEVTIGTVPDVFPNTILATSRDDAVLPYRHRRFLAALPSQKTSQTLAGIAVAPVLADHDWEASQHQTTKFKKEISSTVRDLEAPITLTDLRLTAEQQLSTATDTWANGIQNLVPAPLLIEGDMMQLGNNSSLLSRVTVPNVFSKARFETKIPDLIPEKFRALLPTRIDSYTEIGQAAQPVLGTGELSEIQEQTTEFWRRVTIEDRDILHLPVSLVNFKMTPVQQLETITATLFSGIQQQLPTINARTEELEIQPLGNGTTLATSGVVPDVFNAIKYSVEIPDVIPQEFRAAIPTDSIEEILEGQATPPTLGTGDLRATDDQITEFKHRVGTVSRNTLGLPAVLIDFETTEEYGGGSLGIVRTLDITPMIPDEGVTITKSRVKSLGAGLFLKETSELNVVAWPTLTGRKWDEELQNYSLEEEQVVDVSYTGTSGDYFVENVKPLDKWRSKRVKITRQPLATGPSSAIITYSFEPYQFPGYIGIIPSAAFYKRASARLVKHTIRTWFMLKDTTPTVGIPGSGSDVEFSEIITDSAVITGLSGAPEFVHDVLHDAYVYGSIAFAATTPSASEYVSGIPSGSTVHKNLATLYNPGAGAILGAHITLLLGAYSKNDIIITALGVGNSILAYSDGLGGSFPNGTTGPLSSSYGSQWNVFGWDSPTYIPGTGWIGTERVISATVVPTDIPRLWKIQTKSVVAR
jgi:hypothetical protein